ncbi:hypothetical protein PV08_06662 [Exophiala spinifera]|uniref:Amine oxidase domain-containing protein n=1 Tax=Exophiala spinifera TaxID=91928 RepID=A0A0D1YFP8_9EURO|nr:uncharacterized protein PV08_06662 [Exophiala spinifera]KIW13881.1 hypothetical protein PV08_06662 [Exophiala spinifera]
MSRISADLANAHIAPVNGSTETSTMHAAVRHAIRSPRMSKVPRIAIIGAGVAGLRASDVLARGGCKVTLYEARSRVGGRVHQLSCGGHTVDMGPNWIHGTKGNPIMALADATHSVVTAPDEAGGALYDSDGHRRTDEEALSLSEKVWEMVVTAFKYSDENSATIDPQTSLFDYFSEQIDTCDPKVDAKRKADLLAEAQMWGPFVGDSVKTQSLKFFFLEECIEGENVFVASTYRGILAEMAKVTKHPNVDLHLSTEATNVDYTATDTAESSSKVTVTVTTSNGEEEKASFDEVVVTCPLGWLKRNHETAFTPRLPPRLSEAIRHINYGRLEKLYVTFPSAFWIRDPGADAGADTGKKTSTDNFPLFAHFHDPKYVDHRPDEAWNQSVMSLAHMPSGHEHPTLLFYVYGANGTHMVDAVRGLDPHTPRYDQVLDSFARPYYSRLPTYSSTDPACAPAAFLMTTWQADRFAGNGSYCNMQIGLERGDEDIEVMRAAGGLNERGLWMAGEHTAPFIALGTTTGAWWSGEAVARQICSIYDMPAISGTSTTHAGAEADGEDSLNTLDEGPVTKKDLGSSRPDAANLSGLAI